MIEDAIDRRLLDLLGQASNRQLLMLHAVIDRMLADPRRIIEIRRHLHLGQTVQFLDWQHGVMLKGKRPATTILTARAGLVQRLLGVGFQRWGSSSSTRLAG